MKKRILTIILVCGLCIGISACGEKNENTDTNSSASVSDAVATETQTEVNPTEAPVNVVEEKSKNGDNAGANEITDDENTEKAAAASKSVAVVDNSSMMEFRSENGYSVVYPKKYTVVPESSEIDFLITDDLSNSSVNVSTISGDSSPLFEIQKEGFEMMMSTQNMNITLDLYEVTQINGIDALKIQYTYADTVFTQTYFYIDENRTHCVTFSKTLTIAPDIEKELEQIANTLKNTM